MFRKSLESSINEFGSKSNLSDISSSKNDLFDKIFYAKSNEESFLEHSAQGSKLDDCDQMSILTGEMSLNIEEELKNAFENALDSGIHHSPD